jgi:DNA-binding transcriptional LysR family regulator
MTEFRGLHRLRQFVAVAEELHFGRAAARLGMTQPPLSMQIRQLEAELGVALLRRTKRHVALTNAGSVLLREARRALEQVEQAVDLTRRAGRGAAGSLRIGFISTAAYSILPPLVRAFRARYPDVDVTLTEMTTDIQLEAMANGGLDLGFVLLPVDPARVAHAPVFAEPLVLALPKSHALARGKGAVRARSLAGEPFILFPRAVAPAAHDKILGYAQSAGFAPRIAQTAVQMQTIVGLVSAGLGVALVPACMRELKRPGVVYRTLSPAPPLFETALAWPAGGASETAAAFLETAQAKAPRP